MKGNYKYKQIFMLTLNAAAQVRVCVAHVVKTMRKNKDFFFNFCKLTRKQKQNINIFVECTLSDATLKLLI